MKPIVLLFVGGSWDGKSLSTGSADQEEALLAAACYEMLHHGVMGAECGPLSEDAVMFARLHGWPDSCGGLLRGRQRYQVVERRETAREIVLQLRHLANRRPAVAAAR